MPEHNQGQMGGTMRLGKRRTIFKRDCLLSKIISSWITFVGFCNNLNFSLCCSEKLYGNVEAVDERHRHRYEVNPTVVGDLEAAGMLFPGQSEDGNRMEVMELASHPYYVGVQYHPEYLSRPLKPSAPYVGFVLAASGKLKSYIESATRNGNHTGVNYKRKSSSTPNGKSYFYLNTFDESSAQLSHLNDKSSDSNSN
jgi:CTP synthase